MSSSPITGCVVARRDLLLRRQQDGALRHVERRARLAGDLLEVGAADVGRRADEHGLGELQLQLLLAGGRLRPQGNQGQRQQQRKDEGALRHEPMLLRPAGRRRVPPGYDGGTPPCRSRTMPTTTGTRREFIQTTAAAAAALTIVPRHVLGGPEFVAPSDKVNVAHHRRRRPGTHQRARAVPGGRLPGHRPRRSRRGMGPRRSGTTAASRDGARSRRKSRSTTPRRRRTTSARSTRTSG